MTLRTAKEIALAGDGVVENSLDAQRHKEYVWVEYLGDIKQL